MSQPKRNPGLIHALRTQVRKQVIDKSKQLLMYNQMNETLKNWEAQKQITLNQNINQQLNSFRGLQQGFRVYHRLPKEKQLELDARHKEYMQKIGVKGKEAMQTENLKVLENQRNINNSIQELRNRFNVSKINAVKERMLLAEKTIALERKGIPRELAQQFAMLWLELLKGNIRSPEAFRNLIKKINGKIVFEIQGQKIPVEFFLNPKEQKFLNEYSDALQGKTRGMKDISLKEAYGKK
jgi:hypothetical protein